MQVASLIVTDKSVDLNKYPMPKDAHKVRSAEDFRESTKRRLFDPEQKARIPLQWHKARDKFDLRPGELTMWAGINGHGKSTVTGFAMLQAAHYEPVCIASLEMAPEITLSRLAFQALGTQDPTPRAIDAFFDWAARRLYIYDNAASVDHDHMVRVLNYVRNEYGVGHFVIDSLMKCTKKGATRDSKTVAEVDFVNELATYAHATGLHIHLVHHMRKGERETQMPDKFDVRGASEIVDLADNLVIVWADKRENRDDNSPDVFLKIAKQRNGSFEGSLGFWLHDSLQLIEFPNGRAIPFDEITRPMTGGI